MHDVICTYLISNQLLASMAPVSNLYVLCVNRCVLWIHKLTLLDDHPMSVALLSKSLVWSKGVRNYTCYLKDVSADFRQQYHAGFVLELQYCARQYVKRSWSPRMQTLQFPCGVLGFTCGEWGSTEPVCNSNNNDIDSHKWSWSEDWSW